MKLTICRQDNHPVYWELNQTIKGQDQKVSGRNNKASSTIPVDTYKTEGNFAGPKHFKREPFVIYFTEAGLNGKIR